MRLCQSGERIRKGHRNGRVNFPTEPKGRSVLKFDSEEHAFFCLKASRWYIGGIVNGVGLYLRELAGLAEDLGLVTSNHIMVYNHL